LPPGVLGRNDEGPRPRDADTALGGG